MNNNNMKDTTTTTNNKNTANNKNYDIQLTRMIKTMTTDTNNDDSKRHIVNSHIELAIAMTVMMKKTLI